MVTQILSRSYVDKSKKNVFDMVYQYAEFLGVEIKKTRFRIYDNKEMYVPNPEMVKQFLYRVHSLLHANY
jgi:hypothetical protein